MALAARSPPISCVRYTGKRDRGFTSPGLWETPGFRDPSNLQHITPHSVPKACQCLGRRTRLARIQFLKRELKAEAARLVNPTTTATSRWLRDRRSTSFSTTWSRTHAPPPLAAPPPYASPRPPLPAYACVHGRSMSTQSFASLVTPERPGVMPVASPACECQGVRCGVRKCGAMSMTRRRVKECALP